LKNEIPKHRLLLVLDNVQTCVTSASGAFVELCLKYTTFKTGSVVLITSACSHEELLRTFHDIKWEEVFPVPTLQKEEAACLLAQSAGYTLSKLSSEEQMYVTKFVERCYLGFKKADRQYHPRAVDFLGRYIRGRQEEWVNWNAISQQGEKLFFCTLQKQFDKLLDQILGSNPNSSVGDVTSFSKTIYFDIILTLPRYTSPQSRILRTKEDFCEWYAFTFPKVQLEGIIAAVSFVVRPPNFEQFKCLM
jgi:hypothetical protein